MLEMIGIEAAAQKYEIKKETILIWKRIYKSYARNGKELLINEDELKEFLRWRKANKFSEEYLEELEKLYYKGVNNELYCEIIEDLENEIKKQNEKIVELEKIKTLIAKEVERIKTIYEAISANYNDCRNSSWTRKLWSKIMK